MDADHLQPGGCIGPYRIERPLGRGAWGSVYLASREGLERKVALKILNFSPGDDGEVLERFKREGRAAKSISHQGVPGVLDYGTTPDGVPWLAMEYLEGETLTAFLRRHPVVSPGVASAVMLPILAVLDSAHSVGIVHRDLKPSNVMLVGGERREVKVLDFGIARLLDSALTRSGVPMGTPAYMSPEQTRDARSASAASDLYSAGAVLFELLSGKPPFQAKTVMDLLAQVVTQPAPPLASRRAGLDPRLCALVDRMLSKRPEERPSSAAAVREQLAELAPPDVEELWRLGPRPLEAPAPPTEVLRAQRLADPPPRADRGLRPAPLAAGLAAVALGAAVAFGLVQSPSEPAPEAARPRSPAPAPKVAERPAPPPAPAPAPKSVNAALSDLARDRLSQGKPGLALRLLSRCVAGGKLCPEAEPLLPFLALQQRALAWLDEAERALAKGEIKLAQAALAASGAPDHAHQRYRALSAQLERLRNEAATDPGAAAERRRQADPKAVESTLEMARTSIEAHKLDFAERTLSVCEVPSAEPCAWGPDLRRLVEAERENRLLIADSVEALQAGSVELAHALLAEASATRAFTDELQAAQAKLKARAPGRMGTPSARVSIDLSSQTPPPEAERALAPVPPP